MHTPPADLAHAAKAAEAARLANEFKGVFSSATIERYLAESADRMWQSQLPLLLHRFTRERLLALAQAERWLDKDVPEVLFICVRNSGRSQMAAGMLDRIAAGSVHVRTAGSDPVQQLNPAVIQAMKEVGVDLSGEFPKPLTDEFVDAADAVITMGCGDACPIVPGKHYEDWDLGDPDETDLNGVRAIRDEIGLRVRELLDGLAPAR